MISVVVADDHTLVRSGIRRLVNELDWVEIVAEAADGIELIEAVREHAPNVALVDISMPRLNGIEATRRISTEFADTRVIVLSMHDAEDFVLRALNAGASGFVTKDASHEELGIAIRGVADGGQYFGTAVAAHVSRQATKPGKDDSVLSPRQREILQLIAEGHTSKDIADMLFLSTRTVESHRRNIMLVLHIHDVAGLVRYAIRTGLTTL